jgi:hypothetical protein
MSSLEDEFQLAVIAISLEDWTAPEHFSNNAAVSSDGSLTDSNGHKVRVAYPTPHMSTGGP